MKRKIAAILAADIAGYSRLVAEDEEQTLRRLADYRKIFDEFVERHNGRIFNTAGDAVLANFDSAVDAVRCAIDVQESTRARNMAFPPSRHMNFRIGITIGDVVERDGDMLGEGVNVAARLEGIAPPGGICVSRSVYEAVINKTTVGFSDIGLQQLKNIPDRVHAYTVALHEPTTERRKRVKPPASNGPSKLPVIAAVMIGLIGAAGMFWVIAKPDIEIIEPKKDDDVDNGKSGKPSVKPGTITTIPGTDTATAPAAADLENKVEVQPTIKPEAIEKAPAKAPEDKATVTPDPEPVAPTPAERAKAQSYDTRMQSIDMQRCLDGALDQALLACRRLVESDHFSGDSLAAIQLNYGNALRENGDIDKSIEAFTDSIRLKPTANAYNLRGIAYYDKQNWTGAIADYAAAIKLEPRHGEALNNRAWTEFKAGNARRALPDADLAVQVLAGKSFVWDTRAHINEALGNKTAAIRDYRKAINLDPTNETSKAGLRRLGAKE